MSVGSMMRQEKAQAKRLAKRRNTIILIFFAALIMAAILFSSRLGISYIKTESAPKIADAPMVMVEFKTILVRDDDFQWPKGKTE